MLLDLARHCNNFQTLIAGFDFATCKVGGVVGNSRIEQDFARFLDNLLSERPGPRTMPWPPSSAPARAGREASVSGRQGGSGGRPRGAGPPDLAGKRQQSDWLSVCYHSLCNALGIDVPWSAVGRAHGPSLMGRTA